MCYNSFFFLKFFAALLCLIRPDDLPMTAWTFLRGKEEVEHNLWSKEQTHFWGDDGRERKHRLEVVCNKCPPVALGVFTYLCTAIWSIFLPSALQTSLAAMRRLGNRVPAPSRSLTTAWGGPTPRDEPKETRQAMPGRGEELLSIPLPRRATSSRLRETPGTQTWTHPKNVYFFGWQGFSPLWAPCKNTLSEVSWQTRRLSKKGLLWWPAKPAEEAKVAR